jgi:ubiquitin-conjugating enzyme E2 variant
MSLPALGPASFASTVTKIGAFAACGALLAIHAGALYSLRRELEVQHLLMLALTPFLADVLSGLVHWAADTWGSETTPILGPRFIRPFRVHHLNGADIVSRSFLDLNGDVAFGVAPLLGVALLAPEPLRLFLVALALCILPTNQIHQWAHSERVPRIVGLLQRRRLILTQPDHQRHHTEPFRSHYCITTGWMNPFFEKTGLFVRIEDFVRSRQGKAI